jgi:hypothetical protein
MLDRLWQEPPILAVNSFGKSILSSSHLKEERDSPRSNFAQGMASLLRTRWIIQCVEPIAQSPSTESRLWRTDKKGKRGCEQDGGGYPARSALKGGYPHGVSSTDPATR